MDCHLDPSGPAAPWETLGDPSRTVCYLGGLEVSPSVNDSQVEWWSSTVLGGFRRLGDG